MKNVIVVSSVLNVLRFSFTCSSKSAGMKTCATFEVRGSLGLILPWGYKMDVLRKCFIFGLFLISFPNVSYSQTPTGACGAGQCQSITAFSDCTGGVYKATMTSTTNDVTTDFCMIYFYRNRSLVSQY